jgi:hypothetical protein
MGGGGGGGSSDIQMRDPKQEQKTIGQYNLWDFIGPNSQLSQFVGSQPLLSKATAGAQGFFGQLPGMINTLQDQFGQYQDQLAGYQGQIPGLQQQLSGYSGQLGALEQPFRQYLGPQSALSKGLRGVNAAISSGGALTGEGLRTSQQQARLAAEASGTNRDIGANVNEVLNNEANRQARLNMALGQSQNILGQQAGATGQIQGLLGGQAGITGQQAGLLGLGAGLTGQQAGLATQLPQTIQGLQTGGLNQLLGVENANVGNFTGLQNPIFGYLSSLFGGNQQASIAQAQIAAQQQAAGNAKMGSTAGGALSLVGSIAAAY